MEFVVDTNVVVAGFLRPATTRELLLDERLVLHAPEYLLTEAERVLLTPRLRRRLGSLSPQDVRVILSQLTSRIRILPTSAFRVKLSDAKALVADPEDASFIALVPC
ncbi:MAG: putative toxin-antitoxin system toxin component, PIN family [Candidatus Omnitrophica bacterium]|nr:putative toxin-antitoxin system toxin component, PIN family [Candidatus Omnitrophota bacterium]